MISWVAKIPMARTSVSSMRVKSGLRFLCALADISRGRCCARASRCLTVEPVPASNLPGHGRAVSVLEPGRWATWTRGLALASICGCAPSLAGLRPAEVAPRGHVQAVAGVEVGIPTGTVASIVDASRDLARAAATRRLTDAEKLQLFEAAASFVSSPPSIGPHLSAAYSVRDEVEVNVQYAGGAWRLGGRFQAVERKTGPFDLVAGLGVSHSGQIVSLGDVLPVVHVDGVQRWTVDLPVLFGTARDWLRVWGGPKLVYTHVSAGIGLDLVNAERATASFTARGLYWGGQGGLALGYRALFIGFELTLLRLVGSADVSTPVTAQRTNLDISGWVVTPAFALMGEF